MANIKSIGGNPIVLDASGIAPGAVTHDKLADMDGITAGAALGITGEATDSAAWLTRVSTSDGPTTAKSIHGRTLRWNQLVSDSDTSVTVPSGHKYVARIDGTTTLATSDGTAITVTGGTDNVFDLTAMFGSGNEPSTVAEFEALFPEPYYEYDAGSLLSVNMTGIETTGFNLIKDESSFEITVTHYANTLFYNDADGLAAFKANLKDMQRLGGTLYWHIAAINTATTGAPVGQINLMNGGSVLKSIAPNATFSLAGIDIDSVTSVILYGPSSGSATFSNACINLSDPTRNGEYEPYWQQTRTIPAGTLRSAGTVYDEQTETERIVRVGERAYQSGDESDPTVTTDGTITYYPLTTPTVTPHEQPLNMTYRTEQGGTERVMVPTSEQSAPPTIVAARGYTAESLRDAALSAIAPVENGKASTNYGVGSYLVHAGQLCKVTTAIATGEAITIGTNVTATTVMAEVIALIAQ